jgi:N-acetylglucosamine-6-phosphate deacetylase
MKTYISNVNLISPFQIQTGMTVVLENQRIIEVTSANLTMEKGSTHFQENGQLLSAGFIDVHFHGAKGVDTMDGNPNVFKTLSTYCAEHGVTTYFPTTWASSPEDLLAAINAFKLFKDSTGDTQAYGMHLEGPYLNELFKGAQSPSWIRYPDETEFLQWFNSDIVKLITCAPEIPGGMKFLNKAVEQNIRIAIGHSGATYDEIAQAVNLGATQATHLFNGMSGLHHRFPGTVGGILDHDQLFVQIICDGIHLHPAIIRLICNIKTVSKTLLVTDSVCGAGMPDGRYNHNGQIIIIDNGRAITPEGVLSGSTLSLDLALRNVMAYTKKTIDKVISMVTITPAEAMGLSDRKGIIKPGYDADLVLLDEEFMVSKTFVNGTLVFEKV